MAQIQPPETFDFSTPNEWPKWRKRFERYLVVSGMKKKEEADKIDLFMYLMGDRADDIFRTFKFEKEEEATKIDSVLKAFDSHFCVRKNIIYERAKFNSRIQEDREPVDEFITSLYKLADSCEFEGLHDQLIRDRIVVGVRDKALSERMQLDSELTLEKAVKMVRQQEAVRQQQVDLQRPLTSQKVNQVKFNSKKQSPKQQQQPSRKKEKSAKTRSRCPKCGGFTHREGQACRAEGQRCNLCSKTGHFANCCPDKQAKTAEVKAVSELDEEIRFLLEVSAVEDSSNLDNDEDECRRRWTAEIQVNGKKVKFKLDSQADVTCVPLCLFKKIMGQQRLVKSDINIRAAEFSELQTVGMFISTLRNGNYEIKEKIYVIRRLSEPLLSRRACELLNLARRIEVVATRINPIKEFPEVFEGLGQIGNPYEIKLKPGAKSYAVHTPRRVPIPLMEKLKTRLEELERAGIIAQANVATEWCAPTVIAGKPNGDIRLCVDLSRLNEHVQREVHPMPVVEHMLGQLGEARFFSKLDANSGFHQIPLSPDCQHLTTFITPFGRYKYCRMPFGISLAPEYFQRVMSIILQGMDGVMCYLDDILIFASDSKTHDRILRLVLRKLKEAKVTLNKAKCVFDVPRINFLGHILDEDGIRPDPAKIEAVARMPAPTDVHGVRRFLGMVNHLGRKLRTTLPIAPENLNPKLVDSQTLKRKEGRRRKDMRSRYDRRCGATDMEELSEGDTVWITDMRTWGIVKQKASTPRSYMVDTPVGTLRRNRFHLRKGVAVQYPADPSTPTFSGEELVENEKTPVVDYPSNDSEDGQIRTRSGRIVKPGEAAGVKNPPSSTAAKLQQNYVEIIIDDIAFSALVDSGSSFSVISDGLRRQLKKTMFKESGMTLKVADGKNVTSIGRCTISLSINGLEQPLEFIVLPNSNPSIILGWDFLEASNAVIDCGRAEIRLEEAKDVLNSPASMGKVVASRSVVIPAESTKLINVMSEELNGQNQVLFEPSKKVLIGKGLTLPCALFRLSHNKGKLWIVNSSTTAQIVPKGMCLGKIQRVEENNLTAISECSESNKEVKNANHASHADKSDFKFLQNLISDDLSEEQQSQILSILKRYDKIFDKNNESLKQTSLAKHKIETGNHQPIKHRPYRVSPTERQAIQTEVDKMLDAGIIRHSESPWSSPVILVKKKDVMPFGLCNAPATFERMMDKILKGLKWTMALCYLDDIVVYSKSFNEHLHRLEIILQCLDKAELRLNPKKCLFGTKRIRVFGHLVDSKGIYPDPEKIEAIAKFPTPKSITDVRSFIGLCSYYRRFIENFAEKAAPLHEVLRKDNKFMWNSDQQDAFDSLKKALMSEPVLAYFEEQLPTELHTDASGYGIGAVLVQINDGKERPVGYASRTLSKAEKNYSTTERECLAAIWAINKFRPYLFGREFVIVTDHHALCWLSNLKDPTGRLARWALKLQEYNVTVVYKSGRKHQDADCLSRNPLQLESEEAYNDEDDDIPSITALTCFEAEQRKDPKICKLIEETERFGAESKGYEMLKGTLYKKNFDPLGNQHLLVIPKHLRLELLKSLHDAPTAGHLGFSKTYERVKNKYFWPGLLRDIRKVGMDLLGRFPKSDNGNKWIIVCTDYLTRFAVTKALPTGEAKEAAKFLMEDVVLKHGAPREIITDRGRVFQSKLIAELTNQCSSIHRFTTAYHPQTNGLTERLNKTLANMIAMYVSVEQKDWDVILPYVTFAYNTAKQDTTGFTPFKLIHGREAETTVDTLFPNPHEDLQEDYSQKIASRVEETRQLARLETLKAQEKDKARYDSKHEAMDYNVGDLVWIFIPIRKVGLSEKLMKRYFGPYRVTRKLSDVTFEVEPVDQPTRRRKTRDLVHVLRMKPYHDPEDQADLFKYNSQAAPPDGDRLKLAAPPLLTLGRRVSHSMMQQKHSLWGLRRQQPQKEGSNESSTPRGKDGVERTYHKEGLLLKAKEESGRVVYIPMN
ncbi:hypothetical protein LAZ67_18000031, partial [Cordylochernes scorpioides]